MRALLFFFCNRCRASPGLDENSPRCSIANVQEAAASGASIRVGGCAAIAPRCLALGRPDAVTELRDVLRGLTPPLLDR